MTTAHAARIAELEKEVRGLRRANAIWKSASAFFAAELDRPLPVAERVALSGDQRETLTALYSCPSIET